MPHIPVPAGSLNDTKNGDEIVEALVKTPTCCNKSVFKVVGGFGGGGGGVADGTGYI